MSLYDDAVADLAESVAPTPGAAPGTFDVQPDVPRGTMPAANDLYDQAVADVDVAPAAVAAMPAVAEPPSQTPIRLAALQSIDVNPDEQAQALELSKVTGVPADIVRRNMADQKKQAYLAGMGPMMELSPKLAAKFTDDSVFSKLSHDDLEILGDSENIFRKGGMMASAYWTDQVAKNLESRTGPRQGEASATDFDFERSAWFADANPFTRGGAKGAAGLAASGLGLVQQGVQLGRKANDAIEDALGVVPAAILRASPLGAIPRILLQGDDEGAALEGAAAEARVDLQKFQGEIGTPGGAFERNLEGAISSIVLQAPFLATGSVPAALGGMFATVYGEEYASGREAGLSESESMTRASILGGAEVIGEMLTVGPTIKVFRDAMTGVATPDIIPQFGNIILKDLGGEQVTTALQFGTDKFASFGLNQGGSPAEILNQYLQQVADTGIQTVLQGGIMGTAAAGVSGAARALGRRPDPARIEEQTKFLETLQAVSQASKLAERSPETFQAWIDTAAEGTPLTDVYVDGKQFLDALNQSGVTPEQLAAVSPGAAAQVAEAQAGGVVKIEVGDYAANIANSELGAQLMPHLKTAPEAFSQEEAKVFMKDYGEELRRDTEAQIGQAETVTASEKQASAVRDHFTQQLTATGRFRPEVVERYSTLMGAFYSTMAQRAGTTPEELLKRFPVSVQAAGVGGGLQQTAIDTTPGGGSKTVKIGDTTIDYGVSSDGTTAEVILVKTPEAARGKGSARAALQEFMKEADAKSLTVFLTADPMGKGVTKGRLEGFYKSLGFRPNKGGKRDFRSMAGMVRDPQSLAQSGDTTRGAIAFGTGAGPVRLEEGATIGLFEAADLTSALHEFGHLYLEVLMNLASQPNAPQGIVDDANAALSFMGIPDLAAWHAMDLGARREGHEKWAETFEEYLMTGVAPSIELHGLFQRFAAWLRNVYRSLKPGQRAALNDEIRQVFDRMLASEEQIAAAEGARFAPMPYKTAEQAGMTPEAFAAYLALGDQATQTAVERLQARSLQDMQWLHGAKGRALKAAQKAVASKRANIRAQVAEEVLDRPLYKAMRFLRTGHVDSDVAEGLPHKLDLGMLEEAYEPKAAPRGKPQTANAFGEKARLRFLREIRAKGGIELREATDLTGETTLQAALRVSPGLFRKDGLTLDVIAQDFSPDGSSDPYIDAAAYADVDGGLQALRDMIQDAINGEPVMTQAESQEYAVLRANEAGSGRQADDEARAEREAIRLSEAPDYRQLVKMRMAGRDGVAPDVVAESFGLSSGDHLVRAILAAEPEQQLINRLTDERMLERYGDLTSPQALERAAGEAVHNAARARFVATEMNSLRQATGKPKILAQAVRNFAQRIIGGKRVRDLKPAQYEAAERAAAAAARKAMGGKAAGKTKAGEKTPAVAPGNLAEAALHSRNELIQHYAARYAYEAQDEVERGVRYLKRIVDSDTIDATYRDQIAALLDRFSLRKTSAKEAQRRASLVSWVEGQREKGLEPLIDANLLNEAYRKPYQDMTVDEFRGLLDTVKNIEHLGRLKHKLLTARDKKAFEAVVAELATSITENAKGTAREQRVSDRSLSDNLRRFGTWAYEVHRTFAGAAAELDGYASGGPVWERFVRTMNEKGDWETAQRAEMSAKLGTILAPLLKQGNMGERIFKAAKHPRMFTREEVIGIALNMGNDINRERLLTDFTPAELVAATDLLTKLETDAVQAMWDLVASYQPLMAEKEQRVFGRQPEWVQASAWRTRHGDYNGGYHPIAYDPRRSEKAQKIDEQTLKDQINGGGFSQKSTARGHLKERAESTGLPLRYDFAHIVAKHLNQVIHDLAWHEYMIDAQRLLKAEAVQGAIVEHYGRERYQRMRHLLEDIAGGEIGALGGWKYVAHLRAGVVLSGIASNLFNIIQNFTGITQSMASVGSKWIARGAVHWLGHTAKLESMTKAVMAKSPMMQNRARTMNRDLNEWRNKITIASDDSTLGKLRNLHAAALPAFFYLNTKSQMLVDSIVWYGAYEKAAAEFPTDPEKQVALADQAVLDSQGGGQIKDLAAVMRGEEGQKLFTAFYGWFSRTLNVLQTSYGRTNFRSPGSAALFAADVALTLMIPSLMTVLLRAALDDDDDEILDDPDKLARAWAGEALGMTMASVVGLRELSSIAHAAVGDGRAFPYTGPAGMRFLGEFTKLGTQIQQGEGDEAFWKALNGTGGILFHYPAGQINKTVDGVATLARGDTDNPVALISGSKQ